MRALLIASAALLCTTAAALAEPVPKAIAGLNMSLALDEEFSAPPNIVTYSLTGRSGVDQASYYGAGLWNPTYPYAGGVFDHGQGANAGGTDNGYNSIALDPNSSIVAASGYSPFSTSGGVLKIATELEPASLVGKLPINAATGLEYAWVTGALSTRHHAYGHPMPGAPLYITERVRFAYPIGWHTGFVMYAEKLNSNYFFQGAFGPIPWGADGRATEIDAPERQPNEGGPGMMFTAYHWTAPSPDTTYHSATQLNVLNVDLSKDFHTFGLLWEYDRLTYFIDEQQVYQVTLDANFDRDQDMYLLIGGGSAGGANTWPPPPPAGSPSRVYTEWDYVRVWAAPGARWRTRLLPTDPY